MEEDLKKVVEKIKKSTIQPEETKKYILAVKRVFRKAFEDCKDEYTESEILEMCLEEYNNDLKFRGNAETIFYNLLKHDTFKTILDDYGHNKTNFNLAMREAKRREKEDKTGTIAFILNGKESMISCIRYAMRKGRTTNENDIIEYIKREKKELERELRSKMIRIIQTSVATLDEYGIIDEYIEISNSQLEQLGLSGLKFSKRNPIADEQYEDGQLVKDTEDIGVIDTFSTENLNNMPMEDLQFMSAFYLSKYFEERLGISKAMSTIRTLDLWKVIFHGDDEEIQNLNNDRINSALKKDLALTYLCQNKIEITPRLREQYEKFMEENNISTNVELEKDREPIQVETSNLSEAARDVSFLEGMIIYKLKEKHTKIKRWGVVKDDRSETDDADDSTTIALENPDFRGTLLIEVPSNLLAEIFGKGNNIKLPDYKGKLDQTYCDIMSRLYLPRNQFFSSYIKQAYKENPQSEIVATLAGKKVRGAR